MAKIETMTVSLEEFGRKAGEYALNEFEYNGLTIKQWADKITSGEYQPVKHAQWIFQNRYDEDGRRIYHCSECHLEVNVFPYNFYHGKCTKNIVRDAEQEWMAIKMNDAIDAIVILEDNSNAILHNDATATLYENSSAELYDNSFAELYDNSFAALYTYSSAELWGNSQVANNTLGTITTHANSRIISLPQTIDAFMDFYGVKHTGSTAIMYKAVHKINGEYISNYDTNFKYIVGESKNEKCDSDRSRECSNGISISTLYYATQFGINWPDLALLEVETPIADIILPNNTHGKVRTSCVKVLREVPIEEYRKFILTK